MKQPPDAHSNQPVGDLDSKTSWLFDDQHLNWLKADAKKQLAFFSNSLRSDGGFDVLRWNGAALIRAPQELHTTTRMIHSFVLGQAIGASKCEAIIDAGMNYLWNNHRDAKFGGYHWSVIGNTVASNQKQAYGHAFVLLAASSAYTAGHPLAKPILDDISDIIKSRFIDASTGLFVEEFNADWSTLSSYRGFNANMHGVEALCAAFEATEDTQYLAMAERIITFFVEDVARNNQWRIHEHFDENWNLDLKYEGDPMFRPMGTTPGHSFEMGRLILQHWDLSGRPDNSAQDNAIKLIDTALKDSSLPQGGIAYTLDYNGHVRIEDRYWWPITEAIGAYASLIKLYRKPEDEKRYRELWVTATDLFVDQAKGGWFPEVDAEGKPVSKQFEGKPDIYHALQACLYPLTKGVSGHLDSLKTV